MQLYMLLSVCCNFLMLHAAVAVSIQATENYCSNQASAFTATKLLDGRSLPNVTSAGLSRQGVPSRVHYRCAAARFNIMTSIVTILCGLKYEERAPAGSRTEPDCAPWLQVLTESSACTAKQCKYQISKMYVCRCALSQTICCCRCHPAND
jgi:hypothetical protein